MTIAQVNLYNLLRKLETYPFLSSSDVPLADVRSSLLDGKQQTVNNGSANGNVGLEHDLLAKRNSYASFRGGYDSGMPGDDPPDLIE